MAVRPAVQSADRAPIQVGDSEVECVDEFTYLGSIISSNGLTDAEVDRRIANASKAFGALRPAVFNDRNLIMNTKRQVYQTCVLSVLLYGSECWTLLRRHLNRLNAFHHHCIRSILGITRKQQWEQHITSDQTRELWGDLETITTKVMGRRLEWLGHVARMPEYRAPKMALFGWLPQPHLPGGPRKRWRDMICQDLKALGIAKSEWYRQTSQRDCWRAIYRKGLADQCSQHQSRSCQPQNQVLCEKCGRGFCRVGDKARHKCIDERQKPVHEQQGAAQCSKCSRWFRNRGGLSVHRCDTN